MFNDKQKHKSTEGESVGKTQHNTKDISISSSSASSSSSVLYNTFSGLIEVSTATPSDTATATASTHSPDTVDQSLVRWELIGQRR